MPFRVFERKDTFKRTDKPEISIRQDTLAFNAELTKKAELAKFTKVRISVDEENFRLGFKFHNETNDPHALGLYSDGITRSNRVISAAQLANRYPWIKAITKLKSPVDRRFEATWDNIQKFWVVSLCPAFENVISDKSQLADVKGIYRYKRNGEVVYIGKGSIKTRLSAPERNDWEFDVIEYSSINDPEQQTKWESYWLDRFAAENDRLPLYNKVKAAGRGTNN